jgi:hypothetical protein
MRFTGVTGKGSLCARIVLPTRDNTMRGAHGGRSAVVASGHLSPALRRVGSQTPSMRESRERRANTTSRWVSGMGLVDNRTHRGGSRYESCKRGTGHRQVTTPARPYPGLVGAIAAA